MKIITAPSVYLVGKQELNSLDCAEFLEAHNVEYWNSDTDNASEHLVEIAGRLCYMSFAKPRPGGNQAYINHILEVGHGSVLEHAVYSMIFTGVSRSLTHELVRHRAGMSYSQLSQRYVDESDCAFVRPPGIKPGSTPEAIWAQAIGRAGTLRGVVRNAGIQRFCRHRQPDTSTQEISRNCSRCPAELYRNQDLCHWKRSSMATLP